MKKGERIFTPRFCNVEIAEVFEEKSIARKEGYTEPTHYYKDPDYDVLGKNTKPNHMIFAAVKK